MSDSFFMSGNYMGIAYILSSEYIDSEDLLWGRFDKNGYFKSNEYFDCPINRIRSSILPFVSFCAIERCYFRFYETMIAQEKYDNKRRKL